MFLFREKTKMIDPERALPGRDTPMVVPDRHEVLGNPLRPPFPDGYETAVFGLGCFWGAERAGCGEAAARGAGDPLRALRRGGAARRAARAGKGLLPRRIARLAGLR